MIYHIEYFSSNFVSVHFITNFINNYNLEFILITFNIVIYSYLVEKIRLYE